jgi:hypothetical protein
VMILRSRSPRASMLTMLLTSASTRWCATPMSRATVVGVSS